MGGPGRCHFAVGIVQQLIFCPRNDGVGGISKKLTWCASSKRAGASTDGQSSWKTGGGWSFLERRCRECQVSGRIWEIRGSDDREGLESLDLRDREKESIFERGLLLVFKDGNLQGKRPGTVDIGLRLVDVREIQASPQRRAGEK